MSSQIAKYAAVSMPGVNSSNKLIPDSTGYRRCILGGFNLENHSGVYYPLLPSVKALFETGGIVRRRLDTGLCKGEYGHPKIQGMALESALQSLAIVDELLVSHHIKSIELKDAKNDQGKDIVLAVGMVRPTGPYGEVLEKQMDNPEENVAFSIRSFTNNAMHLGRPAKVVCDVMTYDFVTEPGISAATKFNSASLEELIETLSFTGKELDNAIANLIQAGLESECSTLSMVRTSLGWNKVKVVNLSAIDWR